jgi:CheY-like chemotaxis protein
VKILVVDDLQLTRAVLGRWLTRLFACEILAAADGVEGVEVVQRESPDLVVLDLYMPRMDGWEMLEILRRDPRYTTLPVVAMTASSRRTDVEKLLALGVTDYLVKPPSEETIAKRLGPIVDRIRKAAPAQGE